MSTVTERISAIGIMPVISKLASEEECTGLSRALRDGGIPQMEITFRMANAEKYIRFVRETEADILVGAGTVINTEQAALAIDAGAQFVVAPGLNPEVVRFCQEKGVDVIPGVATASEIEQALGMGLKLVKFFPAEQMGGVATIKALCGPYKGIDFMPTGGVNLNNLASYMVFDRIAACGGTYMLGSFLPKHEWDEITKLCRQSVQTMLGLKLCHIGVNEENAEDALRTAKLFASLLQIEVKEGNSSNFAGTVVEVMKGNGRGRNGHLCFSTPNLDRTVRYFKAMGWKFDDAAAKTGPDGKLKVIYMQDEIGGFAIHYIKE